jgi:hypothetical protein
MQQEEDEQGMHYSLYSMLPPVIHGVMRVITLN